jgi:hypothetical protein
MIAATDRAGKMLPGAAIASEATGPNRERHAAVQAAVMETVDFAAFLVANKDELLAEEGYGNGLLFDPPGPDHRVPVVSKPQHRRFVGGPVTPMTSTCAVASLFFHGPRGKLVEDSCMLFDTKVWRNTVKNYGTRLFRLG